jgi:hypothetical protein
VLEHLSAQDAALAKIVEALSDLADPAGQILVPLRDGLGLPRFPPALSVDVRGNHV